MYGTETLTHKQRGVAHVETVFAVPHNPYHSEILVAHHYGIRRAPFHTYELLEADIVYVGLHGHIETVLPRAEFGQHGRVVGGEFPGARGEYVGNLPFGEENGRLRFPYDELRAFHNLVTVGHGEFVNDGVGVRLRPGYDFK